MKELALKVVLVFVGLCGAVLLAELVVRQADLLPKVYRFRTTGPNAAFQLSDNPILGYEMRPNLRLPESECHNSFPYTNAYGFRDQEWTQKKPSDEFRIILLGDSVVAGHGVCELDHLLSSRLEQRLRRSNQSLNFEVMNFGIGGYCTRAEVELLKTKGIELNPDLVIVLFVENDYTDSNGTIIEALSQQNDSIVSNLTQISHTAQLFEHTWKQTFKKTLRKNEQAVGKNNVLEGLRELKALSMQHDFDVLIVLWPYFTDHQILSPTKPRAVVHEVEQSVVEIAAELDLSVFDLAPLYERDFLRKKAKRTSARPASPRWIYTQGDGTHHSDLGAKVFARTVENQLKEILKNESQMSKNESLTQ